MKLSVNEEHSMKLTIKIGAGWLFAALVTAGAAEIFVAPVPRGADGNPGTRAQPKANIQQAIWNLKPGDTLTLLAGVYTTPFSFARSGTAAAPIRVRGDAVASGGEGAVIDGTGLGPAGPEFSMIAVSANHITIEGIEVRNSPGWGISVWGKTNATIRQNKIFGCAMGGITAGFTDYTTVRHVLIEGNTLRDNCRANAAHRALAGWPASLSVGGNECIVRDNLVERGHGEGIAVGGDRIVVERNVVRNHFSAGIYLDNATNCVVRANFVQQQPEPPYYMAGQEPGYLTGGRSISTGIQLANERPFHGKANPTADNLIEWNVVAGAKAALYYGEYQLGGGIKRTRFERNTFIDGSVSLIHIDSSAGHADNVFADNRCVQTLPRPVLNSASVPAGFTFRDNLWLGGPPPAQRKP